ncbi:uncharacterized protein LOC123302279 [Chrysoperla carnea]|uniref:uncharacterized protein LOC123302266 n=1 Tax=Chrysoperla carnea TaxID=189513 RepID=UPI001D09010C|nr:uncharacterized protein LOC123302266 [Chrysoperla carnea]XP_044741080.1 uncharacterized protein LOC123302279 [Chrysoperla carnea]
MTNPKKKSGREGKLLQKLKKGSVPQLNLDLPQKVKNKKARNSGINFSSTQSSHFPGQIDNVVPHSGIDGNLPRSYLATCNPNPVQQNTHTFRIDAASTSQTCNKNSSSSPAKSNTQHLGIDFQVDSSTTQTSHLPDTIQNNSGVSNIDSIKSLSLQYETSLDQEYTNGQTSEMFHKLESLQTENEQLKRDKEEMEGTILNLRKEMKQKERNKEKEIERTVKKILSQCFTRGQVKKLIKQKRVKWTAEDIQAAILYDA